MPLTHQHKSDQVHITLATFKKNKSLGNLLANEITSSMAPFGSTAKRHSDGDKDAPGPGTNDYLFLTFRFL
jgi:hypothetical protein